MAERLVDLHGVSSACTLPVVLMYSRQQEKAEESQRRIDLAHPAVSIGLLLPTREVVMASGAPDLSKIIDLAVRAEELGFDSVWVGDSIWHDLDLRP